jgi:hypothetical protein
MRRNLLPGALAVLGILAIVSPARGAISNLVAKPLHLRSFAVVQPVPGSAQPSKLARLQAAAPSAVADAVSAVAGDTRLTALLNGAPYQVVKTGPWTTEHSQQMLGTVLLLKLDQPASISGDWPVMAYDDNETSSPPYTTTEVTRTVNDVSQLLVQVSSDGQVVGVTPGPDSSEGS